MQGRFPDYTMDQFMTMLDYFGESPYIVRSSSLLEDTYGNAFAGKYDSVFCVNQGLPGGHDCRHSWIPCERSTPAP